MGRASDPPVTLGNEAADQRPLHASKQVGGDVPSMAGGTGNRAACDGYRVTTEGKHLRHPAIQQDAKKPPDSSTGSLPITQPAKSLRQAGAAAG